jgi:molybdopterin molybdotransferase
MEKLSVEEAAALVCSRLKPPAGSLLLPLASALGRVCAVDIAAPIDTPPFNRSPLDGYALRSADTAGAAPETPAKLQVIGTNYAGAVFQTECGAGQAVRIMTGAKIPQGCDCVIRQEDVALVDQGGKSPPRASRSASSASPSPGAPPQTPHTPPVIAVGQELASGENIVLQGEDVKAGQQIIAAGTRLSYAHLAVLASMGIAQAPVFKQPRICVLSTGDELCRPGEPLPQGKIYNSNETLFSARLRELGFEPMILPTGADDPKAVAAQIAAAADKFDVLISTGAVSVGEKDIFHEVLPMLDAKILFKGLNSRPGGAMIASIYQEKPLFCLSGNPFAALVGFELVVRPALALLAARPDLTPRRLTVRFGQNHSASQNAQQSNCLGDCKSDPRSDRVRIPDTIEAKPVRRFIRAHRDGHTVIPPSENFSGQIFSLTNSNCLLDIPAGLSIAENDPVSIILL